MQLLMRLNYIFNLVTVTPWINRDMNAIAFLSNNLYTNGVVFLSLFRTRTPYKKYKREKEKIYVKLSQIVIKTKNLVGNRTC